MIINVTNTWTALAYTAGVTLTLQNMGRAGDIVEVITSETQPLESDRGLALAQIQRMYRVSGYDGQAWVRYIRYDLNGTNKPQDARTCLLNVQEGVNVSEVGDIPDLLMSNGVLDQASRLKVSTATRQEIQIARGDFFVGFNKRLNVAAVPLDTFYSVFKTGARYGVIEDVTQTLDFSEVTDGRYIHTVQGFVQGSNTSSFSYTPNNPSPAGRALNAGLINSLPDSTIDLGVIGSTTGEPEYTLFDTAFYIDTGGNRNTVNQSGNDFFAKGRQILIPPNTEIMIKAITSGSAVGSANITTTFFFSEIETQEVPNVFA